MKAPMNHINKKIVPHPRVLETLFAYKGKVSSVFKDVLGLFDISHIALSRIDENLELQSLSSTPSLEFNLFKSSLWRFDKTYQTSWYSSCTPSPWQSLYAPERYDELYYLKQMQHHYPLGLSIAEKLTNCHVIYSIASHKDCQHTREIFESQHENFYKIGQYCSNLLLPLFNHHEDVLQPI